MIEPDDPRFKREEPARVEFGVRWKDPDPTFIDAFDIRLYPRWTEHNVQEYLAARGEPELTVNTIPAVIVRRTVTYGDWEDVCSPS